MIEQYEKSFEHQETPFCPGPKVELYKWKMRNERGILCWKSKKDLLIDVDNYQRKTTSRNKVNKIASDFDWMLFEVLVVALRADGRHYVIEGGHRLRAAWKRADIDELPCIVFNHKSIQDEAKTFVDSAMSISSISSVDKYKAQLCAREESALRVAALLDRHGLRVTRSSEEIGGITAVQTLIYLVEKAPDIADDVMQLCLDVCKHDMQPSGTMIRAFQFLIANREALGFDISKGALRERLIALGPQLLVKAMRTESGICGQGGEKVHARGILNALNKRARNKMYINL